ncbi:MAG: prepilin-type N-terminal cleavage/methylation domain-containing protein, partial [Planctomycetes bacterium]|nr:prepilin-type N-terminal cleavage/methylation domain-containing protein [Planctomycetota bacterium]
MRRTAFTILELLIVVMIAMILMGMLFAVGRALKQAAKQTKTRSILAQAIAGLESTKASGGLVSLTDHPLAATAGRISCISYNFGAGANINVPHPRAPFRRHAAPYTDVALDGEALVGVTHADLPATLSETWIPRPTTLSAFPPPGDRLLLPDDHLIDANCPHLFGMQRKYLTVVGGGLKNITWYRRLPKPSLGTRGPIDTTLGRMNDEESDSAQKWTDGNLTSQPQDNALPGPALSRVLRREFLVYLHGQPIGTTQPNRVYVDLTGVAFVTPGYLFWNVPSTVWNRNSEMYDAAAVYEKVPAGGKIEDAKKAFEASLGSSMTELAKLGAIHEPADDATRIYNDRLWS